MRTLVFAALVPLCAAHQVACLDPPGAGDDDAVVGDDTAADDDATGPDDDASPADDDSSEADPDLDPTVRITSPSAGAGLAGPVEVVVEAGDDFGLVEVTAFLDGVLLASGTASPLTAAWDTCLAAPGIHTLSAFARDGAGQTATDQIDVDVPHLDADGDGSVSGCGDCDDGRADVHPGAAEVCGDGTDGDCDGTGRGCGFSGVVRTVDAAARLLGRAPVEGAGAAVAAADLDGDGTADLAVGAELSALGGAGSGAVYAVPGPVHGDVDLEGAWRYFGSAYSATGDALGATDLDGDGAAELLVGAYGDDGGGDDAGSVAALSRSGGGGEPFGLLQRLIGAHDYDYLGKDVAVGDFDGDHRPDLALAAHGADPEGRSMAGRVYVVPFPWAGAGATSGVESGVATLAWDGAQAGDYAGMALAFGDLDGDGRDDLVVGASASGATAAPGTVYVVRGGAAGTGSLASSDGRRDGAAEGDRAGFDVSAGGDVDGDGVADLLIGAPYADPNGEYAGAAYLLHGPVLGAGDLSTADATFIGAAAGDNAGWSVAIVPDGNGDGYDEVLVGVPSSDEAAFDAGAAWLFHGPVAGRLGRDEADAVFLGEGASDLFGIALVPAGDATGDGRGDLLVGALWNDAGGEDAGTAYVFAAGPGI